MGIYFSVNGGGKKVELSVHSVTHTALEVSTGENRNNYRGRRFNRQYGSCCKTNIQM